ncbi:hypothetical protein YSA_10856 [Pseudomonas putida ND6]|uniref:Uncharacterized protein n=1 Tax=Pseudomonas putida ND6 TaxID=231023 RepID=I3V4I7_PSEPU|nr:hypothetical protein YSA_10856 [Pseudomonas putida ND6]
MNWKCYEGLALNYRYVLCIHASDPACYLVIIDAGVSVVAHKKKIYISGYGFITFYESHLESGEGNDDIQNNAKECPAAARTRCCKVPRWFRWEYLVCLE